MELIIFIYFTVQYNQFDLIRNAIYIDVYLYMVSYYNMLLIWQRMKMGLPRGNLSPGYGYFAQMRASQRWHLSMGVYTTF